MALSDRVTRLREKSLNAVATLSPERARLVTEFYRAVDHSLPAPAQRGLLFRYIMEKKDIAIPDGELIVGERGPSPKATSTYPEVCCHSMDDLDVTMATAQQAFAKLHAMGADEPFVLNVRRGDKVIELTCAKKLVEKLDRHVLRFDPDATPEQLALREAWLTNLPIPHDGR